MSGSSSATQSSPRSVADRGGAMRWAIVACCALAACAPLQQPASSTGPRVAQPVVVTPVSIGYEQRLEETARLEDRQGRWGDEAITLELLAILRPDDAALAVRRQALRDRIGVAVHEHLRRGLEAHKRNQLDAAANQYLAALALSPDDQTAADGLRAVEKERNRRLLLVKQKRAAQAPDQGD